MLGGAIFTTEFELTIVEAGRVPHLHPVSVFDEGWQSLCKGSSVPLRSEFKLVAFAKVLPWVAVIGIDRAHRERGYEIRLVGTALERLLRDSYTGLQLLDIWPGEFDQVEKRIFDAVLESSEALVCCYHVPKFDHDSTNGYIGFFPFDGNEGRVSQVFCIAASELTRIDSGEELSFSSIA